MVSPACGGQLHLRLFFNYVGNLDILQKRISSIDWYDNLCTKVSLVYDGDKVLRAQSVATRINGSEWEMDGMVLEEGYLGWTVGRLQAEMAEQAALS